ERTLFPNRCYRTGFGAKYQSKKHLSNLKNIIFSNETSTTISGITPLHEEQTPNHHNSGNTLLFADIRDSF
ncbi:hypothetical protein, partial [uncultured Duncaniella sp.]|uniref:hypothetical protein n=1 Tax=uncultured Duncaniella sp. TaxID=2768039 RepID=UPI0025B7833C